jgi:putative transposase
MEEVDSILKDVCLGIAKQVEIIFIEIGIEEDYVHFLLQSVTSYSVEHG